MVVPIRPMQLTRPPSGRLGTMPCATMPQSGLDRIMVTMNRTPMATTKNWHTISRSFGVPKIIVAQAIRPTIRPVIATGMPVRSARPFAAPISLPAMKPRPVKRIARPMKMATKFFHALLSLMPIVVSMTLCPPYAAIREEISIRMMDAMPENTTAHSRAY